MKELIAKLSALGSQVEVTGEDSLIITDNYTNKKKIVIVINDKIEMSEEYDDIENLEGTRYSIARVQQDYDLVDKTFKLYTQSIYSYLGRAVIASNGVYNIIAKLKNNVYGVIDVGDNSIIPFYHSEIDLYNVKGNWVYLGTTLDTVKFYKDDGSLYSISSIADGRVTLIFEEGVVLIHISSSEIIYDMYDLQGNRLIDEFGTTLVNNGKQYSLLGARGNILIDNMELAPKIK